MQPLALKIRDTTLEIVIVAGALALSLLLLPVAMAVLMVFAYIGIPLGFVVLAVEAHRVRKAARAFACVRCGKTLGWAAVRRGNRTHLAERRARERARPWGFFRSRPRTLHAICTACGTRYTFFADERTFRIEADGDSATGAAGVA